LEDKADFWDWQGKFDQENVYFSREKYDTFVQQARLAWIDRMLDNDEVK
jgi:hypothetical protein